MLIITFHGNHHPTKQSWPPSALYQDRRSERFLCSFSSQNRRQLLGSERKKQMTIPAVFSAKPNTECPADLRWIQQQGCFPPLLVHDLQGEEINQGLQGFSCLNLLTFYFRVREKTYTTFLFLFFFFTTGNSKLFNTKNNYFKRWTQKSFRTVKILCMIPQWRIHSSDICPKPLNAQHQEWTLRKTTDFGW